MGIYVYGLKKNTRQHPVYGELGVLTYIYKPFWSPTPEQERWENNKDAYYKKNWENRQIPRYVVFEGDKKCESVYLYSGGAVFSDCDEHLCISIENIATANPEWLARHKIVIPDELLKAQSMV